MNAIQLLSSQHREISQLLRRLTEELDTPQDLADVAAPIADMDQSAATSVALAVGGEELRETTEGAVFGISSDRAAPLAQAYAVPADSERARRAAPPPTEMDGRVPEAVPGRQFRDFAGHLEDGRTHVGLDAEQLPAQMYVAGTHRFRPDSAIGSGRESTAGSAEQFDNVVMVTSTRGRTGMAHALVGGTPFAWSESQTRRPGLTTEEKYDRFQEIVELLAAHMVIEDQVLYAVAGHAEPGLLDDVRDDERMLKRGLAELRNHPVGSQDFDTRLQAFADDAERHFEEEEGELFPRLAEHLGTAQLDRLGTRMAERHATLMGHSQHAKPVALAAPVPLGDPLAGQPAGTVHARRQHDVAVQPLAEQPVVARRGQD